MSESAVDVKQHRDKRGTRKWWIIGTAIVLVVAAAVVAGLTLQQRHDEETPARAASLGLHVDGAPKILRVGVVYSLTDRPDVDGTLVTAVEGAQVAAYRMKVAGTRVSFVTANDSGTSDGAKNAVDTLVKKGVSAIIVATDGPPGRNNCQRAC